jgi:hypothetical protein
MKKSPIVLAVAALLFIGWMIFLGTQALRKSKPVVVSRAQLLASQYEVEVDLPAPPTDGEKVKVLTVAYQSDSSPPGGEITVTNLGHTQGYAGPGAYLLPLVRHGDKYEIAGYPADPGYPALLEAPKPRIYPLTEEVRRQHRQIRSL